MWILIIVLLVSEVPGLGKITTVLNTYATYQECQSERNRIGFEMAEAYPHDNDFVITCQQNSPRHNSIERLKEEGHDPTTRLQREHDDERRKSDLAL